MQTRNPKRRKSDPFNGFNPFQPLSENAARLERKGDLIRAAEAWEKALKKARNPENRQWCEHRVAFCQRFKHLSI